MGILNLSGRDKFKKYKKIINIFINMFSVLPKNIRKRLFNKCKNINGKKGLAIRYILIKSINKKIGDNVSIHPGCYLFSIENLEIGNNVSIHPMCYIDATGGVTIGSDVSIAHGTTILSSSHSYKDYSESIKYQEILTKKTEICDNVWIGAKCTILYGVKIETGTIIGASSLINKNIKMNSIAFNTKDIMIIER